MKPFLKLSCVPMVLSSLRWKAAKPSGKRPEVERGTSGGAERTFQLSTNGTGRRIQKEVFIVVYDCGATYKNLGPYKTKLVKDFNKKSFITLLTDVKCCGRRMIIVSGKKYCRFEQMVES